MLLVGWNELLSSATAMALVPDSSPGPEEEKRSCPRPRGPVSLSGLGQRLLEGAPAVLFACLLKPLATGCLCYSSFSQETYHRETGTTMKPVTDPNKRGSCLGLNPRPNHKRGLGPHLCHGMGMHSLFQVAWAEQQTTREGHRGIFHDPLLSASQDIV